MEAARELAGRLHIPRALADYRALLADPEIEAVVICSSTDTHAQIIAEAAQVRKHIFCEKPIAHDLSRIDEALDVVAAARVKLQIGFNRRFDPSLRRVREMVAEGKIGQPHILHITSRDPEPPSIAYERVSGGLFLDIAIHDFDLARYLLASEPVEIYAMGGVRVDPATSQSADGEPGRRVRAYSAPLTPRCSPCASKTGHSPPWTTAARPFTAMTNGWSSWAASWDVCSRAHSLP